jgi:hypothetical protein
MFALLFAKVPIAIMLALAVSLFADSRYAGTTQSFVNAGAGLVLGFGALLAPMLAFGLFSFMSSVVTRPAMGGAAAQRAATSAYYGQQMTRTAVNGLRTVGGRGTSAPIEPSAAERQAGAKVTTTPSTGPGTPVPTPPTSPASSSAPGGSTSRPSSQPSGAATTGRTSTSPAPTAAAGSNTAAASGAAATSGVSGSAGAAGAAPMAGPAAPVAAAAVAAGATAKTASSKAKSTTTRITDTGGNTDPGATGHGSITPPSARSTD